MGADKPHKAESRGGKAWLVSELEGLGTKPDSVLACRTRRTIKAAVAMRQHLRIALEAGPRRWTMNEVRLLGTMNDYELGPGTAYHHEIRRQRRAFGIQSVPLATLEGEGSFRRELAAISKKQAQAENRGGMRIFSAGGAGRQGGWLGGDPTNRGGCRYRLR